MRILIITLAILFSDAFSTSSPMAPITNDDLDDVISSITSLEPTDVPSLRNILSTTVHSNHKDWDNTNKDSQKFASLFSPTAFRSIFTRVFTEGNYASALAHASQADEKYVVLITGVNGIRKTTALHQPWFKEVLAQALESPPSPSLLPSGGNSFFRQLDHIIASLTHKQFERLYGSDLSVTDYSNLKATIFTKWRKLSEMCGVELLNIAKTDQINVLVETSGRDIAMFEYIEKFFPQSSNYKKLAIHFTIDEIKYAESSVDSRMLKEMEVGRKVVNSGIAKPADVINVNMGGPYGSSVLAGVQADSDRVWGEVMGREGWMFATIDIHGDDDMGKWSCSANGGEKHSFVR